MLGFKTGRQTGFANVWGWRFVDQQHVTVEQGLPHVTRFEANESLKIAESPLRRAISLILGESISFFFFLLHISYQIVEVDFRESY
jgi:hypothetical protein